MSLTIQLDEATTEVVQELAAEQRRSTDEVVRPLRVGVNACWQQCVRHETSFGSKAINPSSVAVRLSSSSDETRTIVSVCCSNRYEFVKAAVPSWIAS